MNVGLVGGISGKVTESSSGSPLKNIVVKIYDVNGYWVTNTYTNLLGNYAVNDLPVGTYFVLTSSDTIYIDELYDNISCEPYCDPKDGSPVIVISGQTTTGINFTLDKGSRIAGFGTDEDTGLEILGYDVDIYDQNGNYITYAYSDSVGYYITTDLLNTGTYFVLTSEYGGYVDELYDNIMCEPSCDPLGGSPISVIKEQTTNGSFLLFIEKAGQNALREII